MSNTWDNGALVTDLDRLDDGYFNALYDDDKTTVNSSNTISVGTSSTLIVASSTGRYQLSIYNASQQNVYLGASGVTTSNGFTLFAGETINLKREQTKDAWYGVVGSGTSNVIFYGG